MFDPKIIRTLAANHQKAFRDLAFVEANLLARFNASQDPVHAMILAAAGGEPLLLIGPPGTGKSRLIRAFCGLMGYLDLNNPGSDHPDYFEYLLTPFTEPSELFGYYDIPQAMQGKLTRREENMMQHARIVYLDEVFNGSSAILNAVLAFLNERVFHDRGMRKSVDMECLFAATNHIPESADLQAIFDRFVLRCPLYNVEAAPTSLAALLKKGWSETYGRGNSGNDLSRLLDQLKAFRQEVREHTSFGRLSPIENSDFYRALGQLVHQARQYDLSAMSNRRLVKMTYLMLVNRVYRYVRDEEQDPEPKLDMKELQLLPRYFLDRVDEEIVAKMERAVGF